MNGQRVHAAGQIVRERRIDHAMALDPGLSFEGFRYNINPEMGLPAGPRPGVAFMLVGFVRHIEAFRRESFG